MRRLVLAFSLALPALPLPAMSDCAADVAALFHGGPLDPFERPNRRETTIIRAPDGSETAAADVLWDGVTRSINCYPGGCAMMIDREAWMGQNFDGPWTAAPTQAPDDPEAFARAIADDMAANLTEAVCAPDSLLDGRPAAKYIYRTRTSPNEFGSWFGGLYTAWIDAETGRLVRLEETESVASWAPDPAPAVKVTTIRYDETIEIRHRQSNRQLRPEADAARRQVGRMRDHLDPGAVGRQEGVGVARIDVVGDAHLAGVGALHQEEQHGAVALLGHQRQLQHVPRPALGGRIGKLGDPGVTAEGHRFHLDIGVGLALGRQQEVHPALLAVLHLRPHRVVARERRHFARLERSFQHPVGHRGVDPGEVAVDMLDQPPAELQLLLRVVVGLEPDLRAGVGEAHHRAGIGAMRDHLGAVLEPTVGQEPLVAAGERGGNEGLAKSIRRRWDRRRRMSTGVRRD